MGLCADCLPAEQPVGVGTVPAPVGFSCGANKKAVQAYVSLHSPIQHTNPFERLTL